MGIRKKRKLRLHLPENAHIATERLTLKQQSVCIVHPMSLIVHSCKYKTFFGRIVAICMHMVDFSAISGTSVIALPQLLPAKPEFNVNAIVSVTLIFLVSATGFVSALSSVFGCLPITSFSQNVGLVAMTKVVNRFTIAMGAMTFICNYA